MSEIKVASLKDIMVFMGNYTMTEFRDDWKHLSEEDKEFYKKEIGKLLPIEEKK